MQLLAYIVSLYSFQSVGQLAVVVKVPERGHVCPPASTQQLQLLSTNKAVRAMHDIDIRNPDDYELKR